MLKLFDFLFVVLLSFLFLNSIQAQHFPSDERGDPAFRIKTNINESLINTTIFNFGLTGRESGSFPISEQTPYEWPKFRNQVYLALTGIFVGGEVIDEDGNTQHIIDVMSYRTSPEGETWNFEPVPGYYNFSFQQIANSKTQQSWPEFWPDRLDDPIDPGWAGSWDGYLGKNIFIDGQEFYYKFSDDLYDRYQYYPDTTDFTRNGLGLLIKSRIVEMNDPVFNDILFQIYSIKNDGTKPIDKMGLTMWIADFVGGTGDSQDDKFNYDLENNLIYFYDDDGHAPEFGDQPVGCFGVAFLKTPNSISSYDELGITNIVYMPAGGLNIQSDVTMWNDFMIPNQFDPPNVVAGEYDAFVSSSYFALNPDEAADFITAICFGNGETLDDKLVDMRNNFELSKLVHKSNFTFQPDVVQINNPQVGEIISGTINISWDPNQSNVEKSYVLFSSDNGLNWNLIHIDSIGSNNFDWNTTDVTDGILNKLRVYSYSSNGTVLGETEGLFTINNPGNTAPQIFITNVQSGDTLKEYYNVQWISGDADGDDFQIDLFYKVDDQPEWNTIVSGLTNVNEFEWNTWELPNSNSYQMEAISYSTSDSSNFIVEDFIINNDRLIFEDSLINLTSNIPATGIFEVHIVKQWKLTGHDYVVEFDSTSGDQLSYNVYDQSTGLKVVDDATEVNGVVEGPYFDGIRLYIENDTLEPIEMISGWNNAEVYDFVFNQFIWPIPLIIGSPIRADFEIPIGEVGLDTSESIILGTYSFPSKPVNFTVQNLSTGKKQKFGFIESDTSTGQGKFSIDGIFKDRIIILDEDENGNQIFTYWTFLSTAGGFRQPATGDTLFLFTTKPFLKGDSIFFSTQNITSIENEADIPEDYFLSQNYPNPFNPSTTIEFGIARTSLVKLTIYDLLGQKVEQLQNGPLNPGHYKLKFDGNKLSSGVYFYRLEADNFVAVKKLLLLK